MPFRRLRCLIGAALLVASAIGSAACAQPIDYPTQRITILVGFAAGGPVDVIARIIADGLQKRWNHTVVVENRAGAGGNLAAAMVAKANPDGATLLFTATGVAINQSLYENPGYAIKDLAPVSIAAGNSLVFAVHPSNPARTLKEFADTHKTRSFTFGTAGVGSGAHITAEYFFKVLAKVESIHTPYQGSPQAVSALLGNHIDLVTVPLPDIAAQVKQGNLRALAVSGAARVEALPDVPTVGEAGYPGFASYGWIAMFAPAKTNPAIVEKLNVAVNEILEMPEARNRLDAVGFMANRQPLPETVKRLDTELTNWGTMVSAIGVKIK
jgi:tripartite-type tricarboxylate transporter receptor subunit TctC